MAKKSTAQILQRAKDTLATAHMGLRDVLDRDPRRRLGGLRNLIVFGRAVTNVLQNLRATEPSFDEWYNPIVKEMQADPLLKHLYKIRSDILKQGELRTSTTLHISHFQYPKDMQRLGPPPPGAKAFFMGDQAGGSGWEIDIGDGETEKFYVDIPGDIATSEIHLPDAPEEHRGAKIASRTIENIASHYYAYLADVVKEAQTRFANRGA